MSERKRMKIVDNTLAASRLLQPEYFQKIVDAKKEAKDKNDPQLLKKTLEEILEKAGIPGDLEELIECIITNCGDLIW